MVNICTVSDINYLIKGLTLYESLLSYSKDIKLHYLCIDDISYNKLKTFESETLSVYNISELLANDSKLTEVKNRDYRYFCWSLASYFSNYLMNKNIGDITYIDSDILLYDKIETLLKPMETNQVGIFRHRQFELTSDRPEGLFNVGIVHFKNGPIGKHILKWWADAVLNSKYPHLATCGDQKYLDNFPNICPDDSIFIDGDIGHGAPWIWQLYDFSDYEKDGTIIWNSKKQKLLFSHFSQFVFNDDSYVPSTQHHIYTPLSSYKEISGLKMIYDDYYNKLKEVKIKYNG